MKTFEFIGTLANSVFNSHNLKGINQLITRLGLSHLCKHELKHSFEDWFNPFCIFGNGKIESCSHKLL